MLATGYENGCFDAVVAGDVIDHMPIRQGIATVNELARIVCPGGCVLLTMDVTDDEYESEPHTTNEDGDYLFHQGKWNGMVFHPYSVRDIEILANDKTYEILSADERGFIVALNI